MLVYSFNLINKIKLTNNKDIDAGGQRFTAPKEDLLRFKDSQFSSMLTSDNPQQLDTGEYVPFDLDLSSGIHLLL